MEAVRSRQGSGTAHDDLYTKVGLHRSCPDFVLKAVQRRFRKEYHPDALSDRPRAEQLAAQERFKELEDVFRRIEKLRN